MINSVPVSGNLLTTHLVVRCFGLLVSSDAYFKEIGTFSGMYAYATSGNIKYEKRSIRVSQSLPYTPTFGPGRPPTFRYETVLESEVFEDVYDISPTLVADVKCPDGMDCKIQICVLYSSNRTSGKEVILCSTTFSFLEFLKVVNQKGVMVSNMSTQYCLAPKAYVELFIPYPKVFKSDAFVVNAPTKQKNPLLQKYVFYQDIDQTSPSIDCLEATWEPRLAFTIPLLFLDNVITSIKKSIVYWKQRHNIERMRQGLFYNKEEALKRDWHELCVTVHAAKMFPIVKTPVAEKVKTTTVYMALTPATADETLKAASQINSVNELPVRYSILRSGTSSDPSVNDTKKALAALNASGKGNEKNLKMDESLPSSYVDIVVVDSTLTYQLPVGTTNIERFNLEPVYGSNVNAPASRKNTSMSASSEDVKLLSTPKQYSFTWIDSPFNHGQSKWKSGLDEAITSSDYLSPELSQASDVFVVSNGFEPTREGSIYLDPRLSSASGSEVFTVQGEEVTFVKYIPNRSHSTVEFNVYILDSSGKPDLLGKCSLPLTTVDEKTLWLPLQITPEYSKVIDNATVNVSVKLTSPENYDEAHSMNGAAAEFPEVFDYMRDHSGSIISLDKAGHAEDLFEDYRHVIPECYSWLWYIGSNDSDPMKLTKPLNSPTPQMPSSSDSTIKDIFMKEDKELALSEEFQSEVNMSRKGSVRRRSTKNAQIPTISRVDCPLNQDWIQDHIQQLENLADDLLEIRVFISKQTSPSIGATFRPSIKKKDPEYQALPINLHYQVLAVRIHQNPELPLKVEANVSCGSFSPHGLGHKKGGLYHQESELQSLRDSLDQMKLEYIEQLRKAGSLAISRTHPTYELLQEIKKRYCKYETTAVNIAHRRILSLSQALSTAINAFHLKIGMVAEGHLSQAAAINWAEHGMLLLFQGLLSVVGNEKSMLEDTASVVDTLNLFSVRVNATEDSLHAEEENFEIAKLDPKEDNLGKAVTMGSTNDDSIHDEGVTVYQPNIDVDIDPDFNYMENLTKQADGSVAKPLSPFSRSQLFHRRISAAANRSVGNTADRDQDIISKTCIVLHGRQFTFYVPKESLKKLPTMFYDQAGPGESGVVIPLHAVLFTQGIDMQQTVATTFNESAAVTLQADINARGFHKLNRYCHSIQPINATSTAGPFLLSANTISASTDSNSQTRSLSTSTKDGTSRVPLAPVGDSNVHPLVQDIYSAIVNNKLNSKNIDLLAQLERVCLFLNGGRVTFCKSGKDRTGMVITYDQASYLSEKYSLSSSLEGVIRIANIMRLHGTRLLVAEKNIGKKVFSINALQARFLPGIYRPPSEIMEEILKKDLS